MLHISRLIDVGGYDAELYWTMQSVPVALSCCIGVSFVKVPRHVLLLTTSPPCLVLTDEKKRVHTQRGRSRASVPSLVHALHCSGNGDVQMMSQELSSPDGRASGCVLLSVV